MKNEKLQLILEGLFILVFGILIAVLGIDSAMNTYFAVVAVLIGTILVFFAGYILFTKNQLGFLPLALGGALIAIGAGLFAGRISFSVILEILVFALLGGACGLIVYGLYYLVKVNLVYGLGLVVIGAGILALCLCYLNIDGFKRWFWVIVGVLVAVSGGLQVIIALTEKKRKN